MHTYLTSLSTNVNRQISNAFYTYKENMYSTYEMLSLNCYSSNFHNKSKANMRMELALYIITLCHEITRENEIYIYIYKVAETINSYIKTHRGNLKKNRQYIYGRTRNRIWRHL